MSNTSNTSDANETSPSVSQLSETVASVSYPHAMFMAHVRVSVSVSKVYFQDKENGKTRKTVLILKKGIFAALYFHRLSYL